jgi:hypothetical protein
MKLKPAQLLPAAVILISFGAGIGYLFAKDWRRAIYWIAAAVLNAAVTF